MSAKYVLEFDISPEYLSLIDAARGNMSRDEFLIEAVNRGTIKLLNEPHRKFEEGPFKDLLTSFRAHPVS